MKIEKEGTITISPLGHVMIQDFIVHEATVEVLIEECERRVLLAADRIRVSRACARGLQLWNHIGENT